MKKSRREFIKISGITGLSLAGGGIVKNYASELIKNEDYKDSFHSFLINLVSKNSLLTNCKSIAPTCLTGLLI